MMFIGLFFLVVGAINAISPETGWRMSEGWKFKDAEPSDNALTWHRVAGIVCVIVGIVLLFKGCSAG